MDNVDLTEEDSDAREHKPRKRRLLENMPEPND